MTTLPAPPTTFPDLLSRALGRDPARPFVTFYDDATGERVELSVTTYANWVAKTAGLVQDELGLEPGDLVLVDLPTHWLGAVWLGALWSGGQVVTVDPALADDAALVVCGPAGVEAHGARAAEVPVVALSLRPLGAPFTEALPTGVVDYGAVVLAQPDVFMPLDPPTGDAPGWLDREGTTSQHSLLLDADASTDLAAGGRLLTDVNPCSARGRVTLLGPLLRSGGAVWVVHPDEDRWERRYAEERAGAQLRSDRG